MTYCESKDYENENVDGSESYKWLQAFFKAHPNLNKVMFVFND